MDEDRAVDGFPATALCELGDGCGSLNGDVGVKHRQQAARQQHASPPVTLGECRRKLDPPLTFRAGVANRNLSCEQVGCLFQAQAGGDQQIGEQRVARAIAVTRSRTLGPFNGQAAQTNFPEGAVIGEIDETDVGTTGCALIGVIAARDRRTAPIVRSSPDLTMRKRCTLDQPLPFGPSIKLVERGNRPVPRRCRNPELSIAAPPGTMIGTDIIGIGLPDRLAAGRSAPA